MSWTMILWIMMSFRLMVTFSLWQVLWERHTHTHILNTYVQAVSEEYYSLLGLPKKTGWTREQTINKWRTKWCQCRPGSASGRNWVRVGIEKKRLREGQMVWKGTGKGAIWGRREPRKAPVEASARQREYLVKALGWEVLGVGERQKEAEPWNGKVVSESWAPMLRLWRPSRYNVFDNYNSWRKVFH